MGMIIKNGSTPTIPILMVNETDDESAETGLTVTVQISKNGASFNNVTTNAGVATEIANGWYKIALLAGETDTDGILIVRATAPSGADEWRDYHQVVTTLPADTVKLGGTTQTGNDVGADVSAILVDTGTTLQGELDAIQAAVITNAAGADIAADIIAVKAETASILTDTGTTLDGKINTIDTNVDAILVDTGTTLDGKIDALNDLSAADVNTQCDSALSDYDAPTNTEMVAAFTEIKGATWAAGTDTLEHIRNKQTDIETDTTEIGAAGAGLTAVPWNSNWDVEVQSECADALTAYDPPTRAELTTDKDSIITEVNANETKIDALNDLSAADVNAECDTALSDIHLDHLLAVDYSPASKPGTATALLNELVENDVGVSRFTANALEQAPSGSGGGDATEAKQDTIIANLATVDGIVDNILVDTGTTLDGKIDTIDGIVDSIFVDTGTTLDGKINTIDTNVDSILVDTAEIGAAGAGLTNINLPNQTMDITGNITGNLSGSVGSVTGNVGGNVTGSIGSLATQAKADVEAECYDALDTNFEDATGLTADGLLDRIRTLLWVVRNKETVVNASGNAVIYKDDNSTPAFTVNAMLTDDGTDTTRLRAE